MGIVVTLLVSPCVSAQDSPDPRAASTIAMAERLARLAEEFETRAFPNSRFFTVSTPWRIPEMREEVESTEAFGPRLGARFRLAQQLLWDGQPEAALEQLEKIDDASVSMRPVDESKMLKLLRPQLAKAFLLSGPKGALGVTSDEGALESALAVLEESMAKDKKDLAARWLWLLASLAKGERPESVPARLGRAGAPVPFRDVASRAGVDVIGRAGGSALDDFDGDGDLDLAVSSWGPRDQLRLFRGSGDGRFDEATQAAGLEGITGGLSLSHADYDNDGWNDILVLRGGWLRSNAIFPNSLLRNRGDGTFEDVTVAAGLDGAQPGQVGAWADYDNDGDLDLFLGHEWPTRGEPHPSALMRNEGDGSFVDIGAEVGLAELGWVKGAAWGDYDNDDRPDLFVSQLGHPNLLMQNAGPDSEGTWRFFDIADVTTVDGPRLSYPTFFFDYDNDGWLDLFVAAWDGASLAQIASIELGLPPLAERARLFHNERTGVFRDMTALAGVDAFFAMSAGFSDMDGDGLQDVYVGTGGPHLPTLVPNRMLAGRPGGKFTEVTVERGFGLLQTTASLSFGDIDGDGDQDVYGVVGGWHSGDTAANVLLENPGSGHRWLTLRLIGVESNRSAIGARIHVLLETPDGPRSVHRAVDTGGSSGSSSLQQEIGLGDATAVTAIEVRWPATGKTQRFEGVPLDRIVSIREGTAAVELVR